MKDLIMLSHVLSGSLVLVLGLLVMFTEKGNKNHIRTGWGYVISMWWVCLSAFASILLFDFSLFLLVIGIMTFYSTFNGLRVLRRYRYSRVRWYDYLVNFIVMGTGVGLAVFGVILATVAQSNWLLAGLSILFGVFIAYGAWFDYQYFDKARHQDPLWWLYQHIGSMSGSYIAAVSAFAVQNSRHLSLPDAVAWLPWVLPGVVGGIITTRVVAGYKSRKTRIAV